MYLRNIWMTLITVIEEDIPETHKCGQCSREFVTKQALQKHVSDHANEKRKEQQTEKKPTVPVQRNTVGNFFQFRIS